MSGPILFMNGNFLKTFTGSVFCISMIITIFIVIDKATATSGYSCGGKKEMYTPQQLEAKRKQMRDRRKKMFV